MIIEKVITYEFDFPDYEIDNIVEKVWRNFNEQEARFYISNVVCGWDDCDYYTWDTDETEEVLAEIRRRVWIKNNLAD